VVGEVTAVGKGVDPDWASRRVVADTAGGGGYLERAVVAVTGLIAVPRGLGKPRAADSRRSTAKRPNGRISVRGIEQVQFAPADAKRLAERAMSDAAAGRIRPIVGQTFPLERAADAHRAIEARDVIGKTLLEI
jgi:NADPH:quinone reductase